jgi:hypothetical protein
VNLVVNPVHFLLTENIKRGVTRARMVKRITCQNDEITCATNLLIKPKKRGYYHFQVLAFHANNYTTDAVYAQ